ncbi:MAG: GTP-sensing pleiotropic transcriptional regulator CodY [Acidaminococcaceae bacterium]
MLALLEKTRKINKLLQKAEKICYDDVAKLLRDVIGANIYIVASPGDIMGLALQDDFECDIMREQVLKKTIFPAHYVEWLLKMNATFSNIAMINHTCAFKKETTCVFADKFTTVVPIFGNGERLGTLILAKFKQEFIDADLILSEHAATVIGVEILHERAILSEETARQKAMVQIAFSTLSYSELEAIEHIIGALQGLEGLLVASKIADKAGITRSVIVNALRKFESAGLIQTRSLGMKGTFIKILNSHLLDELNKRK